MGMILTSLTDSPKMVRLPTSTTMKMWIVMVVVTTMRLMICLGKAIHEKPPNLVQKNTG